ncbi:type IV pilus biogenesis/stability protein PilW [Stenotrophomonas sp. 24(2023)]|uniref:type IV pilus biogenesis/stability protein PilW n=1 Tax=Stenotrophomonas sp. 24(2023) TaxID=3068324 RepID=UPI0027E09253|nr:type IV pilus biogenesis/stability protein PilW [Stenotrophomonas sp. 24(2023)]WMJ68890.1 type IV pilus biogenesis/stability protein PilW [Stenotrophomonas sp. 24(2023)]
MLRPDRLWPALIAGALAVVAGGCGKGAERVQRGAGTTAPEYVVRDSAQVRRQVQYQDQLALAGRDLQAGNLESAEKRARAALKIDGSAPDAWGLLAGVADRRGQVAQSGELFRKAADMAPERGDVLNNYGAWLCQHGRPAESLAWLDRAIAAPGYATPEVAQANAGSCALDAGQSVRAERDLRAALVRMPANPVALEAMAQLSLQRGQYLEARAFAERRLSAAPATRSVLQLASQIEARLGDQAAADRYLQRIGKEFPQDAGS